MNFPSEPTTKLFSLTIVFLIIGFWGITLSAETTEESEPLVGHKEVVDDKPEPRAIVKKRGSTGQRQVYVQGNYVSVQVNVDSNGINIPGDAANEPSIAVDPTNPARMVIGWRQFDSISSNFRQAGAAYSHDGGENWIFPGVLSPGVFSSDPVLDCDNEGNFYYYALQPDRNEIPWACFLYKSYDGGITWPQVTYARGGDKAWMSIDRTGGAGDGNIYMVWNSQYSCCEGLGMARSTNGGVSRPSAFPLPRGLHWGTTSIGPDGELYVSGESFYVAKSSNAWNAQQSPVFDFVTNVNLGGAIRPGSGPNPGGLLGQAWVATDHSESSTRGNVYLMCSIQPAYGSDPLDIMFSRSTDGGITWSSPIRINDDPEEASNWQWFGTMSVAPNGRIDIVWNDTRNHPSDYTSELYYSFSADGGLTWSPNVQVSPSFNPNIGYPRQNKLGDYYDMISDNLGVSLAYAATFNGEQDVYFLRIGTRDCNGNEIDDQDDIFFGTSLDCNTNNLPDECETDCNTNGIPDDCDLADGIVLDCNGDRIPDICQLVNNDCNGNGVPDDCERRDLIAQQPEDDRVCENGTAVFSIEASDPSYTFQWYKDQEILHDGMHLSGTTADTLTVSNVDTTDTGLYKCEVSKGCVKKFSIGAELSIPEPAIITENPVPTLTACLGNGGLFTVSATGSPPFTYEWYKAGERVLNNERITGADTDSLLVRDVNAADTGDYSCIVSNQCGSQESSSCELKLEAMFALIPLDRCTESGGTSVFKARVTTLAEDIPDYYWRKDGVYLADDGRITGSHTSTLTINNVVSSDGGAYEVVALSTNCTLESPTAILAIDNCPICTSLNPGDMDGDSDYDLVDLQLFTACFENDVITTPGCTCANLSDDDYLINLLDWQNLESILSGPE